MTRYIGPIARIRDLKDWSRVIPPNSGWQLSQEALDGYGYLIIQAGVRPTMIGLTTYEFSHQSRMTVLEAPGNVPLSDLAEARRLADLANREADTKDNTKRFLLVWDDTESEQVTKVDITNLPETLVSHIREKLESKYCVRDGVVIFDTTEIYGVEIKPEIESDDETSYSVKGF